MGTYLVTGGSGQIGSFLCEELASRGDSVISCDVRSTTPNRNRIFNETVDISNPDDILRVAKAHQVDNVIHLAAVVLLDSIRNPPMAYRVNIIGTNNVLEAARVLDVKKVVFASSVVVYGRKVLERGTSVKEDALPPEPPSDPYSTSKLACELMGSHYREKYGMDISCLRIAAAWGPGRYTGYTGQFNEYVRRVAKGDDAVFPADFAYKKARLRWLYVKDVANAFAHVAGTKSPKSYLFNTGSREPFGAKDVLNVLRSLLPGKAFELNEIEEPTAISAGVAGPNGQDVDCSRLYDELGFSPRYSLQTAMADMLAIERAK